VAASSPMGLFEEEVLILLLACCALLSAVTCLSVRYRCVGVDPIVPGFNAPYDVLLHALS
jgi:hypothetical protein